ncbi:hypothetical protein CC79DRAFT_1366310 [Sarocladium strictum]
MSISQYCTATNIGTGLAASFATLGIIVGISAFTGDPTSMAEQFGVNVSPPATDAVPFIRACAARNIGSGIGIFTLIALGKPTAVGILLSTSWVVMVLDGWIVAQAAGRWTSTALGHVGFIPVSLLTSWLLIDGGQ